MLIEAIQAMVIHLLQEISNRDRDLLTYSSHNHNNPLHQVHHLILIVNLRSLQSQVLLFLRLHRVLNIRQYHQLLIVMHLQTSSKHKECRLYQCRKIILKQDHLQVKTTIIDPIRFVNLLMFKGNFI